MALKPTGQRHFREKGLPDISIAYDRAPKTFWTFSWVCNLAYIAFCVMFIWGLIPLLVSEPFANPIPFEFLSHGLVGLAGRELVSLVAAVGFYRGYWMAIEGHRPRFADLIRWDGAAINRLFLARAASNLVRLPPLGLAALVGFGLSSLGVGSLIWWPIGLLSLVWLGWFEPTQSLLDPLCLFRETKPFAAMRSSMQIVKKEKLSSLIDDSNRPTSNALLDEKFFFLTGNSLLGFRNFFNPWEYFCRLAAYRQVFGAEDRLGLMKPQS